MVEDNSKKNPNESYTKKYQKHVACRYCYKLVCVDDKFSKPLKSYLGEDGVYSLISSMVKEVNIVVLWWKNILTKNLWWLKKTMEILRTLLNVEFVTMILLIMMLK